MGASKAEQSWDTVDADSHPVITPCPPKHPTTRRALTQCPVHPEAIHDAQDYREIRIRLGYCPDMMRNGKCDDSACTKKHDVTMPIDLESAAAKHAVTIACKCADKHRHERAADAAVSMPAVAEQPDASPTPAPPPPTSDAPDRQPPAPPGFALRDAAIHNPVCGWVAGHASSSTTPACAGTVDMRSATHATANLPISYAALFKQGMMDTSSTRSPDLYDSD